MKNKYTLIHRHEYGTTVFYFMSEKTLAEVAELTPDYSQEPTEKQQEFLHLLGVDYDTPDEEIDVVWYETPEFTDID